MPFERYNERVLVVSQGVFGLASGPSGTTPITGALEGTLIDIVLVTSIDSVDRTVQLSIDDTFGDIPILATKVIPAGAGSQTGILTVDMLAGVPQAENGLWLQSGAALTLKVITAVTADGDLGVYVKAGRF